MSERFCLFSVGVFALAATVFAGSAAAQDYDAGKTGPQLFASDCSACHNSPRGLTKGKDRGSLTSFLAEHYTSKRESAQLLAAFLLGAGPGDARQEKAGVPAAPKVRTRKAEREEERKGEARPEPKGEARPQPKAEARPEPRSEARPEPRSDARPEPKPRAEPARRAQGSSEAREEGPKRARDHEPPKGGDTVLSKLKYYGSARGEPKDTARVANPQQRIETYANSASGTVAPGSGAHNDAAPAASKRKASHRKKTDADASANAGPRQQKPAPQQRPAGNN